MVLGETLLKVDTINKKVAKLKDILPEKIIQVYTNKEFKTKDDTRVFSIRNYDFENLELFEDHKCQGRVSAVKRDSLKFSGNNSQKFGNRLVKKILAHSF